MVDKTHKFPFALYLLLLPLLFLGVGALYGGGMLIAKPDGALLGMQQGWLDQSPFHDYLIPGIVLFIFNGLFPLFTCIGLVLRPDWPWANVFNLYPNRYWAWTYSIYTGIIVIIWIIVQQVIAQYFWIQPVMISTGLLILVFSLLPRVMTYFEINNTNS